MASPAVTYTFANSTTADAGQVNTNFTDLISAMTDGTKDFSIAALTLASTLTANGNVTLGNSSSDDLTITASLASTINLKTTNTYNIGSATIGLAGVYFGSSGGAFTTRVVGGAAASSYTLTLPATGGTAKQVLYNTNGSGTIDWASALYWDESNDRVGIGISSPSSVLHVRGASGITDFTGSTFLGTVVDGATSTDDYVGIDFKANGNSLPTARIGAVFASSGSVLTLGTSNNYGSGITHIGIEVRTNGAVFFPNSNNNTNISTAGPSDPCVGSGTYTPSSGASISNIAAVTFAQCQWLRVGNMVTVSGRIELDPTSSGLASGYRFNLPIASNFTSAEDCAGVAWSYANAEGGQVYANTANDQVAIEMLNMPSAANSIWYFTFTYEVK